MRTLLRPDMQLSFVAVVRDQLRERGSRCVSIAEGVPGRRDPQPPKIGQVFACGQFERARRVALRRQTRGGHEAVDRSGLRTRSSAASSATIA